MMRVLAILTLAVSLVGCSDNAKDPCASAPCENGGTCVPDGAAYVCICAAGYSGATCATQTVDACASAPCQNGGVCVDEASGYACACAAGYSGAQCETNIDDCTPNRCFNGGACTDGVDSFTCTCLPGYWGTQCEAAIPQLALSGPASLFDAIVTQAYSVSMASSGGVGDNVWSIETGGTNVAWLAIDAASGVLSGTPAAGDLGAVSVTVRVADKLYPANFAHKTYTFSVVTQPASIYDEDFEGTCPDGWALTGDWQCGVPTSVGPTSAYSGTQCLGTQLAGNYSNGDVYASTTATSSAIALPTGMNLPIQLTFRTWLDTEGGTADGFNLAISTNEGGSYTVSAAVTPAYPLIIASEPAWGGHQGTLGWQLYSADLTAYAGQTVLLRFAFQSDASNAYAGVYLDDVHVGY